MESIGLANEPATSVLFINPFVSKSSNLIHSLLVASILYINSLIHRYSMIVGITSLVHFEKLVKIEVTWAGFIVHTIHETVICLATWNVSVRNHLLTLYHFMQGCILFDPLWLEMMTWYCRCFQKLRWLELLERLGHIVACTSRVCFSCLIALMGHSHLVWLVRIPGRRAEVLWGIIELISWADIVQQFILGSLGWGIYGFTISQLGLAAD